MTPGAEIKHTAGLFPYKPRLMLLGIEAVEYPALRIWAHTVVDGAGNLVCGAHTKGEAERIRDRYAANYPQRRFYVS